MNSLTPKRELMFPYIEYRKNQGTGIAPVPFFYEDGCMNNVQVMGILNVTPDSFSDGGKFTGEQAVTAQVKTMLADGVDIIDIGGESTRPFAEPVTEQEELDRVIPAIQAVRVLSSAMPISIDTTKAGWRRRPWSRGPRSLTIFQPCAKILI